MAKHPPRDLSIPPSRGRCIIGLLAGIWYVLGMASILRQVTGMPAAISLLLMTIGSAVIMAVLVVFGVKAYKQKGPIRQFQLSSLFLLMVPIAIYSAAIRSVAVTLPANLSPLAWLAFAGGASFYVVMSTVVLLWFADALMWVAVLVVRTVRQISQSDSET